MTPRPRHLILLAALILGAWVAPSAAGAKTVWLCRPGVSPDPCTPGLSTTVYSPSLNALRVVRPAAVRHPALDCFYVYPTVSDQKTTFANLHIDPEERSIALYQAARYSQYCKVYAPMYRQLTLSQLGKKNINSARPLNDVRAAFAKYLRRYNHGRGFVLIGHSQGSFVLRALIAKDVDPKPALRKRMLSAILLGGNVLVKRGRGIGGDFKHVPACRSASQLGCVIAFSTYDQVPPANSLFGRTTVKGDQVLCTNPAALAGGSAVLDPIFPSQPFDPGSTLSAGIRLLGLDPADPEAPCGARSPAPTADAARRPAARACFEITARHGAQVAHPSPDRNVGPAPARRQHRARRPRLDRPHRDPRIRPLDD